MKTQPALTHTARRTRIKICGLAREQDVDAAVAAGADALGFVLYEQSPRYVSAQRAAELAQRLPAFVTPVLLFVNADARVVRTALQMLPQATLQFHGDESAAQCIALAQGQPWIKAARIPVDASASRFDLIKFAHDFSSAQALLLDAYVPGYGGGGETFPWSQLVTNVNAHLVLSGGLTPANVAAGITQLRPRGLSLAVDVSSGVELDAPGGGTVKGVKDAQKIHQFVSAVRTADALFASTL